MAVTGINYDEGNKKDLKYKSVYIHFGDKQEKVFDSGNFVKDWFDLRKFQILEIGNKEFFANSSTVDHFIMDGAPYDSAFLVFHEQAQEHLLYYGHERDPQEGIEFFVPEGTQPTWKELKEMCK